MKTLTVKNLFRLSLVSSMALLASACQTTPQAKLVDCSLSPSHNLDSVAAASLSKMQTAQCHYEFDGHFAQLLNTAKGDPKSANKSVMAAYINNAAQAGVISKLDAKDRYNRYFHTTFMSLPENYNVCSAVADERQKDRLMKNLERELKQKKEGLLGALKDQNTYYQAQTQYTDLLLMLEATAMACQG